MAHRTCSVDGCERPHYGRDLCKLHYQRLTRLGTTALLTDHERFWSQVEKTETCWLWTGPVNDLGYGRFGTSMKRVRAHRWAYEDVIGPIPEGLVLDHLCYVKNCVRPDHLDPVPQGVNALRAQFQHGLKAAATHCPEGHAYDEKNTHWTVKGHRQCRACWPRWRAA